MGSYCMESLGKIWLFTIGSVYCCKTIVEVVILLTWSVPSLQLELAHFYNKH